MKGLLPQHEEVVARTPYDVNSWIIYLDDIDSMIVDKRQQQMARGGTTGVTKKNQQQSSSSSLSLLELYKLRDLVGRRAVNLLPRSYKLWKSHWEFALDVLKQSSPKSSSEGGGGAPPTTPIIITAQSVLQLFERALVTLHKFPRVWVEYLEFSHSYSISTNKNTSEAAAASSSEEVTSSYIIHPTQLRQLADRALEALPVTQHDKIWPVLLKYYQTPSPSRREEEDDDVDGDDPNIIPKETKLSLLRRYIQFNPTASKQIADFFADELGQFGEAALLYVDLLNGTAGSGSSSSANRSGGTNDDSTMMGGGSSSTTTTPDSNKSTSGVPILSMAQRKDLWMSLAKICTRHPLIVEQIGLDFDAMVRAILVTFRNDGNNNRVRSATTASNGSMDDTTTSTTTQKKRLYLPKEMEGILWSQLADSWIRRGEFQLARSVYEEAIESVSKVRDFTILLDAYLQFEEGLLESLMENQPDDEDDDHENSPEEQQQNDDDWDILLPQLTVGSGSGTDAVPAKSSMSDLELALARAEDLTARRPILLNRVLLRQNPDDVGEWLKRARLYKENEQVHSAAAALEEALVTVRARRSLGGNPNQLVIQLAKIYEEDCADVAKARDVFDRVCNRWMFEFKNVDDLAECYTSWVELELRQEAWDDALDIIRSSVVVPAGAPKWVRGLAKSLRLWDLLLDLEESLGTTQTTKDAYSRAISQKVVTPVHILNFANFLTEQKYFEEAFTAYERGIDVFEFPAVKVVWKAYLDAFLKRYGGTKLERTRDLFQRCIAACPPEDCIDFFLMDGKFEEEHGLTKRALGVYRQMCEKVVTDEKYTAYKLYIAKTAKNLGQTATRDIYQAAIQELDDNSASRLCLDFADMEASLQEIDRARAVLTYGAQMADPRRNENYWNKWNEFEIANGNEETFREMLRIKRSVEAAFSTVNYNAAEMSGTATKQSETLSNDEAMKMIAEREGVQINQNSSTISGFKRSSKAASLDEVEERVAKLRKATAAQGQSQGSRNNSNDDDDDEIDIDDELDEGDDDEDAAVNVNSSSAAAEKGDGTVQNVSTKAVPDAVFGGLKSQQR